MKTEMTPEQFLEECEALLADPSDASMVSAAPGMMRLLVAWVEELCHTIRISKHDPELIIAAGLNRAREKVGGA